MQADIPVSQARPEPHKPARALVVGPLFLDIVMGPLIHLPEPGTEEWVDGCAFAAGGAANQAVALSRLGVQVQLLSFIGKDAPGRMVSDLLSAETVGLDHAVQVDQQSVTVSLSLGYDRAMVTRGTEDAPRIPMMEAPAVLLADLRAVAANRAVLARWREEGISPIVIADVGWDPSGDWAQEILENLDLVDVFVPNSAEALAFTRADTVEDAGKLLAARVPTVIITCGAKGAHIFAGESHTVVANESAVEAVDPTGAGDIFSAGLAWGLLQGQSVGAAVRSANAAAAWSVQRLGGSVSAPRLGELQEILGQRLQQSE